MIANNSRLLIIHIEKTVFMSHFNPHHVQLRNMYHVPGIKKNLLSVSQLTTDGNYVVFKAEDVKVYHNLKLASCNIPN